MNLLLYTFLITLTLVACTNGKAGDQEPGPQRAAEYKSDTAKRVNFPGTAIYMDLPPGFAWNAAAMGFYKEADGSVIKFDEFKTIRYAASMPIEEPAGALLNQQSLTLMGGYKGEIKIYQQSSTDIVLVLTYGDHSFREFIEASYFSNREQTGRDILTALKTIQTKR